MLDFESISDEKIEVSSDGTNSNREGILSHHGSSLDMRSSEGRNVSENFYNGVI